MPWLVGAALIHSQAVTEKRGTFGSWTLLLAIAAFALSLLGTFLVRSGVLTSVHSFAADPSRGLFILVFLSVLVGGGLLLYALRASQLSVDADDPRRGFTAASRETLLLAQQPAAGHRLRDGPAGHAVPAAGRCAVAGQDLGRPALLRQSVPAADGADDPAAAVRPAGEVAARPNFACIRAAGAMAGAGRAAGRAGLVAGAAERLEGRHRRRRCGLVALGTARFVWQRLRGNGRFTAEMLGMIVAHAGIAVFLAGALLVGAERAA